MKHDKTADEIAEMDKVIELILADKAEEYAETDIPELQYEILDEHAESV